MTEEKERIYQHAIRGVETSLAKAQQALDVLALALTTHNHQWTPEERRLYEEASPGDREQPIDQVERPLEGER